MATVLTVGQISVTDTPIQIVAALATRTELRLRALTAGVFFIGPDNTVTPETGYNPCGNQSTQQVEAILGGLTGAVWAVVASSSMVVAFLEIG